ncbi:MAG TPA: hypothetical protein VK483_05225 [Chitinophagaceae bacterium]|nr:hypothetical protein [Chitinophagaceae bacterium]
MKKTTAILFLLSAAALISIYVGCGESKTKPKDGGLHSQQPSRLPANVLQSCTLTQAHFNSWFASGTASENGLVVPANSVLFPHNNNCDFYQWSWQMFAWMTSPVSGKYTAGNTVIESTIFYTVSPPQDAQGDRTLIPHKPGTPLRATSSIPQLGPNRLPLIRDKAGNLIEVEQQATGVKPMLLKGTQKVAISSVDMDASGKPVFKDEAGKIIDNPKAVITHKADPDDIAQEFKTSSGKSVFINAEGKIIETEVGQAGGGNALMAQNGSVLYYITMVNDVFAFYLSGVKNGVLADSSQFPITAAQRDNICAYARANGATLPDSNALAMEIKTSWIEASKLPDPQNYITIDAIIPTYKNSGDTLWVPNGEKTEKLALLGFHVVGSVAGHPEMVWATFEHNRNTPNDAYQYLNSDSTLVTQPADSGGNWTLSANAPVSNPNVHYFKASGDTLKAYSGYTISPSNSSLVFTWGTQANVSPNAEDGSSAASNSEIISINNTVLNFLVGNDVRKNYMLIGATWTFGGTAPNGKSYSYDPSHTNGDAIGTSLLANSTMETYFQRDSTSCFYCHNDNNGLLPADLSHVYPGILPLFKTMTEANKPK